MAYDNLTQTAKAPELQVIAQNLESCVGQFRELESRVSTLSNKLKNRGITDPSANKNPSVPVANDFIGQTSDLIRQLNDVQSNLRSSVSYLEDLIG